MVSMMIFRRRAKKIFEDLTNEIEKNILDNLLDTNIETKYFFKYKNKFVDGVKIFILNGYMI